MPTAVRLAMCDEGSSFHAATQLSDQASDADLMAMIRDGDQHAYGVLVNRHLPRTYALARRLTGGAAEAEDIAQDAFMQVWRLRRTWSDEGAQFTTWLYRVVVNKAIDHRRKPKSDDIDAVPERAADTPDALDALHRRRVADRLRQAQKKLPEQQRVAVTLYYFEGLNASDVATVMSTSVGAVESLLKRARHNLRRILVADARAVRDSFDDG